LRKLLIAPERFAPIPRADDREAWESLPEESRREWIVLAEKHAGYAWPAIRMDDYMAYWRTGEMAKHIGSIFERRSVLGILAIAECIEGRGRFLDQIVNGVFATCEETSWVSPGHRSHWDVDREERIPSAEEHGVELFTAEAARLLAWIRYLHGARLDAISRRIGRRIVREVRSRLLVPYMARDDYWWMGFREGTRINNWNPWCNGAVLTGFLLVEDDPAARAAGVAKAMRSLDAFLATYPPDGCCDEGPSYWSAAGGGLHECLELLHMASEGRIDVFGESIVRDIGAYIYKAHIHGDYFVSFADCDARSNPGGEGAYRYGRNVGDEKLARLGASLPAGGLPGTGIWFNLYGYAMNLLREKERTNAGGDRRAPYVRDVWFADTQVMAAREREGDVRGLYVAAKGGHNAESHNHNDVGNFLLFADGFPLFVDLGTEEYSAKTFGPERYSLWYLQSQYHNLPTANGALQASGEARRAKEVAYRSDDGGAELAMDISEAYVPEAGLGSWTRTVRLNRGSRAEVVVADDFASRDGAPLAIFHSLITPCEPKVVDEGRLSFEYAEGRFAELDYDAEKLEAGVEKLDFMDDRLRRSWGERMYRVVLREKEPVARGARTITVRLASAAAEEDRAGGGFDQ